MREQAEKGSLGGRGNRGSGGERNLQDLGSKPKAKKHHISAAAVSLQPEGNSLKVTQKLKTVTAT